MVRKQRNQNVGMTIYCLVSADASAEVTYPESTALKTQHLPKPLSQSLRNLFSG